MVEVESRTMSRRPVSGSNNPLKTKAGATSFEVNPRVNSFVSSQDSSPPGVVSQLKRVLDLDVSGKNVPLMTTAGPPCCESNSAGFDYHAGDADDHHKRSRSRRRKQEYRSRRRKKSLREITKETVNKETIMATPRTVIISVNESTIDYLRLNENKIVLVFDRSTPTGAIFHPTPEYIGKNLSSSYGKGRLSLKKTRFRKFVILTKLEAIVEHLKLKGNPVLVRSVSIVSKSSCADVFAILVFSGFSPRSSQHTSLVPVEVQRDIFDRPPTMVGNGTKHHATYGKMIGHGVTAVYRNKDGASFDVFRRGGVEDYSNTVIMLFIDSMSKCLEEWIPGFTQNGNIIPALLYQNCSPKWHEKFDLSHFNSICGLFFGWSCFSSLTKKFHQDPNYS